MSQQHPERSESPRSLHPDSCVSRPASKAQPRQFRRYKLILLRDATNELMFIVRTVMELTRLCRAEATHKMWESHHIGRSQLLLTHKERAELYVEQFASRGLNVMIEPA